MNKMLEFFANLLFLACIIDNFDWFISYLMPFIRFLQ